MLVTRNPMWLVLRVGLASVSNILLLFVGILIRYLDLVPLFVHQHTSILLSDLIL